MSNDFPWHKHFTERQIKEINYCLVYSTDEFRHGTDGHNIKMIVAQMAAMLNKIHYALGPVGFHAEIESIMGHGDEKNEL